MRGAEPSGYQCHFRNDNPSDFFFYLKLFCCLASSALIVVAWPKAGQRAGKMKLWQFNEADM